MSDELRTRTVERLRALLHHPVPPEEFRTTLHDAIALLAVGPTGEAPEPKLDPSDHGELCIAINAKDGTVLLLFGAEVSWLGLRPNDARSIAAVLLERANDAERQALPPELRAQRRTRLAQAQARAAGAKLN